MTTKKNKSRNKQKIIEKRYEILIFIIILAMFILIINLFNIQIIKNEYYKEKLKKLTNNIVYGASAPRGRIYDRNGKLIVDNKGVNEIYYMKNGLNTKEEIELAYFLAQNIDMKYNTTALMIKNFWIKNNNEQANLLITKEENKMLKERKITSNIIENYKLDRIDIDKLNYNELDKKAAYIYYLMNNGYSYSQKTIKKYVTDEEYALVASNLEKYKGLGIKTDWERIYPYGNVFRSILGSVSENGIPYELKDYYLSNGYSLNDRVGISYLEKQYENLLRGTKNKYKIENGNYVLASEGQRGKDLVLTIDIELQKELENILNEQIIKAKKSSSSQYYDGSFAVISQPNTGEILAMSGKKIAKVNNEYKTYDYTPGIVTNPVVMGSAVKGASHIVGYNTNALKIGEKRNDACLVLPSTPNKCSWKYLGVLDDITALKLSSNTYQYHTAIKVGKGSYVYGKALKLDLSAYKIYRDTFAQFGLGVKTGIDLPIESEGFKGKSEKESLILDFAIGQYDSYTTMQMVQYINTIANGGSRIQPHLLKAVYEPTEEPLSVLSYEVETIVLNKVDTQDIYLDRVKLGFKEVMGVGGTGIGYIDRIYKPAGKTGTSQSIIDTNNDGYVDTMVLNNSFVGYAPYDNPKVSFTVVSPVIYYYKGNNKRTYVNQKISYAISKKFFEIFK